MNNKIFIYITYILFSYLSSYTQLIDQRHDFTKTLPIELICYIIQNLSHKNLYSIVSLNQVNKCFNEIFSVKEQGNNQSIIVHKIDYFIKQLHEKNYFDIMLKIYKKTDQSSLIKQHTSERIIHHSFDIEDRFIKEKILFYSIGLLNYAAQKKDYALFDQLINKKHYVLSLGMLFPHFYVPTEQWCKWNTNDEVILEKNNLFIQCIKKKDDHLFFKLFRYVICLYNSFESKEEVTDVLTTLIYKSIQYSNCTTLITLIDYLLEDFNKCNKHKIDVSSVRNFLYSLLFAAQHHNDKKMIEIIQSYMKLIFGDKSYWIERYVYYQNFKLFKKL